MIYTRGLNTSLNDGLTDGKYRKARPNTVVAPGAGEEMVEANRANLHPFYGYGFVTTEVPEGSRSIPGRS